MSENRDPDRWPDRPLSTDDLAGGEAEQPPAAPPTSAPGGQVEPPQGEDLAPERPPAGTVEEPHGPGYQNAPAPTIVDQPGAGQPEGPAATATASADDEAGPNLVDRALLDQLHGRWAAVQAGFVDDPQQAVRDADQLVAEVIQNMADMFAQSRQALEGSWNSGGNADTEELRRLFRRYRALFDVLLNSGR